MFQLPLILSCPWAYSFVISDPFSKSVVIHVSKTLEVFSLSNIGNTGRVGVIIICLAASCNEWLMWSNILFCWLIVYLVSDYIFVFKLCLDVSAKR
uniref:Uncharacterized protein n=1 Tax=Noccaea caerulescens TaxID=107243 RepID=A0A1J3F6U0_NOCCA